MAKDERESPNNTNDSESNGNSNSNSENESETLEINSTPSTNYEKQRQARIAANNARMKALGLRNIANSLIGTPPNPRNSSNCAIKSKKDVKKKGKGGEDDDDDEYVPDCDRNDGDGESNSSSNDDDDDFEEEEETFIRRNKFNPKKKVKKPSSSKQVPISNPTDLSVFMDEDEALKQALALSLKDLGEIPDTQHGKSPQSSKKRTTSSKEKSCDHFQQDNNTNKRKRKLFTSRVQMTDDDLVIHFCQIDEVGKGGITIRDVERMAATHDFNWTDKELSDMIRCFDSDRDGKLTLDDFRSIVQRCNMLQTQLNS
ncbi:uncharacterized protein LOC141585972 [Silene latifolia]|uniref:uncharacterized protein LOC141585972 n=1 Tax=Silene latifolia TaxID=37657 RepID=UPI003D76FFD8